SGGGGGPAKQVVPEEGDERGSRGECAPHSAARGTRLRWLRPATRRERILEKGMARERNSRCWPRAIFDDEQPGHRCLGTEQRSGPGLRLRDRAGPRHGGQVGGEVA
ncbi:unnamed protein product, partial [Scytosiphon promiscuus]